MKVLKALAYADVFLFAIDSNMALLPCHYTSIWRYIFEKGVANTIQAMIALQKASLIGFMGLCLTMGSNISLNNTPISRFFPAQI
ncbi:hypothetical protein [Neobacillus sp. OS1-33]|uniref:hypothetical protein n=1 Tax=Neobacillus sp. OS1-33 TaxID=3070683 RepID=UPI0027E1AE6B|nr:hypothetical protein [Neobacillus sp. OS1-33]WML25663.1 hypothetical protein RCG22_23035 [Neobacillus sp. OS1-33]